MKTTQSINSIPVYIVEEHHEAFIAWKKAINDQLIPAQDNILFHFDAHADFCAPTFNRSIRKLGNDFKSIVNFTFKEMGIASFIVPSIYLGIVNQFHWFKYENEIAADKESDCFVVSYNGEGLKLITGEVANLPKDADFEDIKKFKCFQSSIHSIPSNKKVLLDIDLDFFSCTGIPMLLNEIQVEITKQEYDSFKRNRYHKLNYSGVCKIDAVKRKGCYYYLINYYKYTYPIKAKKTLEQISEIVKTLGQQLLLKNVQPTVITICRSRHSGYTPDDQWEQIEHMLLAELNSIYKLEAENLY